MLTSTFTSPLRRAAGALVLVGVVVVTAPGTASASPPDQFEFNDTSEFDFPACSGAGYLVHVMSREAGRGTLHVRDGQSYFKAHWSGHNTLTNTATGKSVEIYAEFNDKDSKITDNGDGTITIANKTILNERDYAPDGSLAFKTSGKFEFLLVIDLMGTPSNFDDDEVLSNDLLRFDGRNDRDGVDFCAWFDEVTA